MNARIPATVRNVIWNWGAYAFSLLVNFFLSPFVVHRLGDAAYGVWVLMLSVTSYLGFLDLGVRGAVTRYVSKFYTRQDHVETNRVVSTALAIFTLAGLLAILVAIALNFLAVGRFNIPPEYQKSAREVLLLSGATVAVSLLSGVFGGILTGLQRFDLSNIVGIPNTGLRAVATVAVLLAGKGIVALAWVQLIMSAAGAISMAWLCFRIYPQLEIRKKYLAWSPVALIFSFSVASLLFNVSSQVIYYTDAVVIGIFLPVGLITFFAIAGNLMNYARGLISGISFTMTPLASSLEAAGEADNLRQLVLSSPRYATLIMMPIAATFILRGHSFIQLWMGQEYAALSGTILWILTLGLIFSASTQVLASLMFGINKHKVMMLAALVEAAANLIASIVLVRSMGLVGVAWGTTVPNLAASLFFWPWFIRRTLGIPAREFMISAWGRPILAVLPFALASFAIDRLWPASNLAVFFLQVAAVLPLALLADWYLCFSREQRQTYWEGILRRWKGGLQQA